MRKPYILGLAAFEVLPQTGRSGLIKRKHTFTFPTGHFSTFVPVQGIFPPFLPVQGSISSTFLPVQGISSTCFTCPRYFFHILPVQGDISTTFLPVQRVFLPYFYLSKVALLQHFYLSKVILPHF